MRTFSRRLLRWMVFRYARPSDSVLTMSSWLGIRSDTPDVHVRAADGEAKLWLEPQIRVAVSYGFDAGTLRELVDVAQNHREMIDGVA